jgi:hypothetical protein
MKKSGSPPTRRGRDHPEFMHKIIFIYSGRLNTGEKIVRLLKQYVIGNGVEG